MQREQSRLAEEEGDGQCEEIKMENPEAVQLNSRTYAPN